MRGPIRLLCAAVVLVAMSAMLWSCGRNAPTAPKSVAPSSVLSLKSPAIQAVMRVQNRHTPEIMRIDGVVGTATGLDDAGSPAVLVYTERALAPGKLPASLDGYPVVATITGKIIAFKGGGGGVSHTAPQTPPIQLGCSGSPALDIANGFCCGGTLGSLVTGGGRQYILSNSHVFTGDVVSGGNGRVSTVGDDVIQPGLIDVNCSASGGQVVADVSSGTTIYPPSSTPNIDAAIAEVRAGMVRSDGAILEIGTLSASTVAASIGQNVKKSGRTTGLSRSSISGLNATISVGYTDECGGSSFTKTYTGQIVVNNRGSKFLNSGDSGSLMVEDAATNPRAVGLLYAGSSTSAIANPIGQVLQFLGTALGGTATMVGN